MRPVVPPRVYHEALPLLLVLLCALAARLATPLVRAGLDRLVKDAEMERYFDDQPKALELLREADRLRALDLKRRQERERRSEREQEILRERDRQRERDREIEREEQRKRRIAPFNGGPDTGPPAKTPSPRRTSSRFKHKKGVQGPPPGFERRLAPVGAVFKGNGGDSRGATLGRLFCDQTPTV
jgi:hypothetical protein